MEKTRAHFLALALALSTIVAMPAQAQLFGPSDEEIEAERVREENQNDRISDQGARINELNTRVRDMEMSLREATGRNEVLDNRINQLTQQLERQQRDFDYKLCTITARQLGAGTDPAAGGIDCASAASSPAPRAQENVRLPGGAIQLAPPPGTLGTLDRLPPGQGGGQGSFDVAMNLLSRNQLTEARAGFRGFADANPDDPLAPQALHWVGRIAFNQSDYQASGQAFGELIKKYPKSTLGPDSMLRLGQSLIAMGQKNEGCLTFSAIKTKYPTTPAAVINQATIERRNAACR